MTALAKHPVPPAVVSTCCTSVWMVKAISKARNDSRYSRRVMRPLNENRRVNMPSLQMGWPSKCERSGSVCFSSSDLSLPAVSSPSFSSPVSKVTLTLSAALSSAALSSAASLSAASLPAVALPAALLLVASFSATSLSTPALPAASWLSLTEDGASCLSAFCVGMGGNWALIGGIGGRFSSLLFMVQGDKGGEGRIVGQGVVAIVRIRGQTPHASVA